MKLLQIGITANILVAVFNTVLTGVQYLLLDNFNGMIFNAILAILGYLLAISLQLIQLRYDRIVKEINEMKLSNLN